MVLGEAEILGIKLVQYADLADTTRFRTSLRCYINLVGLRSNGGQLWRHNCGATTVF